MDISKDNKNNSKKGLKFFFIKLISISITIVFLFNLMFNLYFSDRLEKIDKILLNNKNEFQIEIKQQIREEIKRGLNKENLIPEEDKILLYKFYQKLEKEFLDIDKSKL
jgi:cell division protein YceG involved in septum cleavage